MAERGAVPQVPVLQRRALKALRGLFTPLLPDDYLELINPLWSTQELRGRIERVQRETDDAVTVFIKPGWEWPGHEPGQYLRIGFVVDGVHQWRAYSLTWTPAAPTGSSASPPSSSRRASSRPGSCARRSPGRSCGSATWRAPSRCPTRCPTACSSSAPAAASPPS